MELSAELSDAIARYTEGKAKDVGRPYEKLFNYAKKALQQQGIVCGVTLQECDDEAWSKTGLPKDMKNHLFNDLAGKGSSEARADSSKHADGHNSVKQVEPPSFLSHCGGNVYLPVDQLFWSHDKIYNHFSDDRSVFETVCDLLKIADFAEHDVFVDLLPALHVVDLGGRKYSLSNRRLFALREFQHILTRLVGPRRVWAPTAKVELRHGCPFTTNCNGEWVALTRPSRITFSRHEHGPRMLSQERVRSLSRGGSVTRELRTTSLPRVQRSPSRTRVPAPGHESGSITMPGIVEGEVESIALCGDVLLDFSSGGLSEQTGTAEREKIERSAHVLHGPLHDLSEHLIAVETIPAASRRGRSLQRGGASEVHDEREPWWRGVAHRPHVSEEGLLAFSSQWQFERRTVDMLRRLQPGLLYYVIRDFAPPAIAPGKSRFGYDGILNKFVRHAEWKLEQETNRKQY